MNKGVLAVLAVFFGFWLFTDPHGLATFTQSTGDSQQPQRVVRQILDQPGTVGHAIHRRIMHDHEHAVTRRAKIDLHEVRARLDRIGIGLQGILRGMRMVAAVSGDKKTMCRFRRGVGRQGSRKIGCLAVSSQRNKKETKPQKA